MEKIIENNAIDDQYYRMKITNQEKEVLPGQFYMIHPPTGEKILGRPLSVFNVGEGFVEFLYQVVGEGTKLLSQMKAGEEIKSFGPYGNGFPLESKKKIACIGGGVGIAPLYYLSKKLKEDRENEVTLYLGLQETSEGEKVFEDLLVNMIVKKGGFITDGVPYDSFDVIYTCGPKIMMEKVAQRGREGGAQVYVSLEERMGCGFGACLACSCKTTQGNKRVCKDGPIFQGEEVFMNKLETVFLDFVLKNPLVMASGTYGYGRDFEGFYSPNLCGGIVSKGITLNSKSGNDGIRIWETPSGILNSIGLENPGVKDFCENTAKDMKQIDTVVFANLGGNTLEEYLQGVELLNETDIDILELNISCPNVKEGGMAFGLTCNSAEFVTGEVVKRSKHPVVVKLSPNGEAVADIARACEAVGAHGISLINTLQGMAVDVENRKAVFNNIYAGLSGPAIKPVALRMVHQVAKAVKIPVMGLGGIASAKDVVEFLMVGATCVQIGTANFSNPYLVPQIIEELEDYCERQGLHSLSEIRGII